jgi:hypothetical protein
MERRETFDVIEVPENVPNLLGQVPLEVLDFVVDAKGQKLIPNPANGGEQMTEEYSDHSTLNPQPSTLKHQRSVPSPIPPTAANK